MGSKYDESKPTKYLQYLDANNLYGWAMSQPLPTGGFHWVELRKDRSLKIIVEELVVKKDYGYLLEIDVAYPKELHSYHNDLPFMCAKMKINGVKNSCQFILQAQIRNTHQSFETSYRPWTGVGKDT